MIKQPDREPDYIFYGHSKFWFNEMIIAHMTGKSIKVIEYNGVIYQEEIRGGARYIKIIQEAWKN